MPAPPPTPSLTPSSTNWPAACRAELQALQAQGGAALLVLPHDAGLWRCCTETRTAPPAAIGAFAGPTDWVTVAGRDGLPSPKDPRLTPSLAAALGLPDVVAWTDEAPPKPQAAEPRLQLWPRRELPRRAHPVAAFDAVFWDDPALSAWPAVALWRNALPHLLREGAVLWLHEPEPGWLASLEKNGLQRRHGMDEGSPSGQAFWRGVWCPRAPDRRPAAWRGVAAWRASAAPRGADLNDSAAVDAASPRAPSRDAVAPPEHQGHWNAVRASAPAIGQPTRPHVLVLGAGLAGASAAAALAQSGLQVTVLEAADGVAQGGSSQPAGIFHGVTHADDGAHARLLRAGAETMARQWLQWQAAPGPAEAMADPNDDGPWRVPGAADGLWRGSDAAVAHLRAVIERHDLAAHVQAREWPGLRHPAGGAAIPAAHAHRSPQSAWYYPRGGWSVAKSAVQRWLQQPGILLRTGARVARLERHPAGGWRALAADGRVLGQADAIVLSGPDSAAGLVAALPEAASPQQSWPLRRVRGQSTLLSAAQAERLGLPARWRAFGGQPLAAGHYALQLADGAVLCGATQQPDDADPQLRTADHRSNLRGLERLFGVPPDEWVAALGLSDDDGALRQPPAPWQSRPQRDSQKAAPLGGQVGWRWRTPDRLPLLGAVPARAETAANGRRPRSEVARLPRVEGLWLWTGLGSRGLSLAALGGATLAALMTGRPVPLPADLLRAVDPARGFSGAPSVGEGAD